MGCCATTSRGNRSRSRCSLFPGELHDDKTLPSQIEKLKARFGLSRVVVVSDRGMVTKANYHLRGLSGRAAGRVPQPARGRRPRAQARRPASATERGLAEIAARVERGTLQGADQIGLAVGPALKRYRVKKHFEVKITDTTFTYLPQDRTDHCRAAVDGIYVPRTSVPDAEQNSDEVVRAYKQLKVVERAFRTFKGPELEIRPIHHRHRQNPATTGNPTLTSPGTLV